jgi:hypothetical protein
MLRLFDHMFGNLTLQAASLALHTNLPVIVTLNGPAIDSGGFAFSFDTTPGAAYAVEYADALPCVIWHMLTNITGTGSAAWARDTRDAVGQRFYRVVSR